VLYLISQAATQPSTISLPAPAIMLIGLIVPVIIKFIAPVIGKIPVIGQIPVPQWSLFLTTIFSAIVMLFSQFIPASEWALVAPLISAVISHYWHGNDGIATVSPPTPSAIKTAIMFLFVGAAAMLSGCANVTTPTTQPTQLGVTSATEALNASTAFDNTTLAAFKSGLITSAQFTAIAPYEATVYSDAIQAESDAVAGSSALQAALNQFNTDMATLTAKSAAPTTQPAP
jgi:hypothetical protein